MQISNSKKELARIISETGGWRNGEFAAQDGDGGIGGYKVKPEWDSLAKYWWREASGQWFLANKIKNHHQTVLSRAEYFHLYPAPDADGWIEWNGGDCPVGGDVCVKFRSGAIQGAGMSAHRFYWKHDGDISDIIAYRLHKLEQAKPESAQAVEAKPTIEQLASDYRNKLDYANRKQDEADKANMESDAALAQLEDAIAEIGFAITPLVATEKESELVITDWRDLQVGDEIEVFNFECPESESRRKQELMSGPCVVMQVESGNVRIELKKNLPTKGSHWNATGIDACEFKFIRRP